MPPAYRRTRREALWAILIWAAAALWTVGGSLMIAAADPAGSIAGVPLWAAAAIFAPWAVFFAVHCWYSLVLMSRDDEER